MPTWRQISAKDVHEINHFPLSFMALFQEHKMNVEKKSSVKGDEMKVALKIYEQGKTLFSLGQPEKAFWLWMKTDHSLWLAWNDGILENLFEDPVWPSILYKLEAHIAEKNGLCQYVKFTYLCYRDNLVAAKDQEEKKVEEKKMWYEIGQVHLPLCEQACDWGSLLAAQNLGYFYFSKLQDEEDEEDNEDDEDDEDDDDLVIKVNTHKEKIISYLQPAAENNLPEAQKHLGVVYKTIKNYDQAIYWCGRAMEHKEKHSHYLLGRCYTELGNHELARQMFERGVQEVNSSLCAGSLATELLEWKKTKADKSTDLTTSLDPTPEQVVQGCDYFHRYGFFLSANENEEVTNDNSDDDTAENFFVSSKRRMWLRKTKRFYKMYKHLIDFNEEYRKMVMMVTNIGDRDGFSSYHTRWAMDIVAYLIASWPVLNIPEGGDKDHKAIVSPFYLHAESYIQTTKEKFIAEVAHCVPVLPIELIHICHDYLFALPKFYTILKPSIFTKLTSVVLPK